MTTCGNGHENPENQTFCGDCGYPLAPIAGICALGHVSPEERPFCRDCGGPIGAPEGVRTGPLNGRWNVDPGGRHQYRYWDGDSWTAHVADNGEFGTDPLVPPASRRVETWVGIVAGIATIVLVIGAIGGIAMQLSGTGDAPAVTPPAPNPSAEAAAPEAAVPSAVPAPPTARPAAVIGTACRPNSSDGVTADGSTAHCVTLQATDLTMWSLYPGDIAPVSDGNDPAVAVCMTQTERTAPQCLEYLQRPSDPGDGPPAA